MKIEQLIILLIVGSLPLSCRIITRKQMKQQIINAVHSDIPEERIEGFIAIGKTNDSSLIPLFFEDIKDGNVSFSLTHKGRTVRWAKVKSLIKLSGIQPPTSLPSDPDTTLLITYREWAERKGLYKRPL